jgi:ABC-type antimicrobial peptide transport system permease subunit
LIRLVLVDELRAVLIGLGLGLGTVLALRQLFAAIVFEISPSDPITLLSVGVALLGLSLAAAYVPARRAGSADPSEAMRT